MARHKEILLFLAIGSLHMASFLPIGGEKSVVSVDNMLLLLGLVVVFTENRFRVTSLSKVSKTFLNGVVVLIIITPIYWLIKDMNVFGYSNQNVISIIRAMLRLYLIVCFIKYLGFGIDEYKRGLNFVLFFGVVIVLSMMFVDFFKSIGFRIRVFGDENDNVRIAGITDMNVNANGAMLAILFGVCLKLQHNKLISNVNFFIYSAFYIIGIFLSGSRTALAIASFIYLFHSKEVLSSLSGKMIILNVLAFVIMFWLFGKYSSYTLSRIQEANESNVGYGGLGYRIGYWQMYFNDITKHPLTFFFGNIEPPTYKRSVHNFYIHSIFYSGIILLSVGLIYIIKGVLLRRKNYNGNGIYSLNPFYIVIPQFMYWITGTEAMTWFAIIMLFACGVFFKRTII